MRHSRLSSLVVAAGVLLFTACGKTGRLERQIEWVHLNPDASEEVKRAVLGKKLIAGMSEDAVLASWGEPAEKLSLGGGDARWVYRKPQVSSGRRFEVEYTLVFRGGILIAVHQQRQR